MRLDPQCGRELTAIKTRQKTIDLAVVQAVNDLMDIEADPALEAAVAAAAAALQTGENEGGTPTDGSEGDTPSSSQPTAPATAARTAPELVPASPPEPQPAPCSVAPHRSAGAPASLFATPRFR